MNDTQTEVLRLKLARMKAHERGFHTLTCEPRDKSPWNRYSPNAYNSATKDLATAMKPYDEGQIANYGVSGKHSNLVILDIDKGFSCEEDFNAWMEKHELPATYTVRSGKRAHKDGSPAFAVHLYYQGQVNDTTLPFSDVSGEIKSAKGYVIGQGSVHPDSGERYEILRDLPVTPVPDSVTARLKPKPDSKPDSKPTCNLVPAGERNPWLASLAGTLHNKHFSELAIFEMLKTGVVYQCEDGESYLAESEEKIRDIARRSQEWDAPELTGDIFHTEEEWDNVQPVNFVITGFLQEDAVTFIGGLSGHAKTLILLAMSKALLEGKPLFNHAPFAVNKPVEKVVYLIPESTLSPFKDRMKKFGLESFFRAKQFRFRTLTKDGEVDLTDPRILTAVNGAHVFLDTVVRFMDGEEVVDSKKFAKTVFDILKAGAKSVTAAHHSSKAFDGQTYMSLENVLRGSGDIGAMCATCWGVKQVDKKLNQVIVMNCKPRDFQPCEPFVIQGRPFIDDTGTFHVIAENVPFDGKPHTFGSIAWSHEMIETLEGYPEDKRKKIESAIIKHQQGFSNKQVGIELEVSDQTVANWIKDFHKKVKDLEKANAKKGEN